MSSGNESITKGESFGEELREDAYVLALSREGPKRNDPSENQDAYTFWADEATGVFFCALADGHGSSAHDRSRIGAQNAVDCAKEVVQEFIESNTQLFERDDSSREFREWWTVC